MVMDSLDESSPLERFISTHKGGKDMGIFKKIFNSTKPQSVAGDSAVVSTLLQSISVGADPKTQVQKVRDIVGDADPLFSEYLGELEMAGDEKPEVVAKAVDIVDNYYKEHLAGDEKTVDVKKKKEDGKEVKDVEVKEVNGDSIDYDRLADALADRLSRKEEKIQGDENPMPMAGDSSIQTHSSEDFMNDIFGGQ